MGSVGVKHHRQLKAVALAVVLACQAAAAQANSCAVGTYLPPGGVACLAAPVGFYVPTPGASAPTAAPVGSYVPTAGASTALIAPAGTYVPSAGASAPTVAPAGTYVIGMGASAPTLVPAGKYSTVTGATSPLVANLAPVGTYVPTPGASAPTLAPPGTFVAFEGATAPTPAPVGRYVPTAGSSTALLAPAGTYVPTAGASAPTPAPAGYFVPDEGAAAPTMAANGYYVAGAGQIDQILCPTGSNSYGAGVACRDTSESITGGGAAVVGPAFGSSLGSAGPVVLASLQAGEAISVQVSNDSSDLGAPNVLTDLTLLDVILGGADGAQFVLEGFTPGTVLSEGGLLDLALRPLAGFAGAYDLTLTFVTDQFADPGQMGKQFEYRLSGSVTPVPEASAWGMALAGLAMVLGLRQRGRRRTLERPMA